MNREKLVKSIVESKDSQYLLQLLKVLQQLSLTYSTKFCNASFLQGLRGVNADFADLITLLQKYHLLSSKEISRLISDVQKGISQIQSDFYLVSTDEEVADAVKPYLEKTFGKFTLEFDKNTSSDEMMMAMKGNGYAVKRSLSDDVDKMLA